MSSIYPPKRTIGAVRSAMNDIGHFARHTGQLIEDAVREEASLLARAAIKHSPSMSAPNKSRDKEGKFVRGGGAGGDGDETSSLAWGERAVDLDIRRIIMKPEDSLLSATDDFSNVQDYIRWRTEGRGRDSLELRFLNQIRLNPDHQEAYTRFKAIFHGKSSLHRKLDSGGLKSWHDEMRKKFKGRIRKNQTVDKSFFARPEGHRIADASTINSYIKEVQTHVGWLKSGWLACINQIGPVRIVTRKYPMGRERKYGLKGLAKYIFRHSASGKAFINFPSVYDSGAALKIYRINIVNMVGNAGNAGTTAKTIDKTLAYRAANRKGKLKRLLNLSIDHFNNEK